MEFKRASGILLHPTSLPGPYGIGDLGDEAFRWIDFLSSTKTQLWQILPLGPTGFGDSPYQCFSAFAGNPYLISFDALIQAGLCDLEMLSDMPDFPPDRVDFGNLIPWKMQVLRAVFDRFTDGQFPEIESALEDFKSEKAGWLPDFALFMAMKDRYGGAPWWEWDLPLRTRKPQALKEVRETLKLAVEGHTFLQFLFFQQWGKLQEYARSKEVKLIGDIPIFVAHDSSDVWANHELFHLDEAGSPTVVAGVPPDYFSRTGQLWGNPLYRWETHAIDDYQWWADRFKSVFGMVDIVRLDHFRGFAAAWEIPGGEKTAVLGRWEKGPGATFFQSIEYKLGHLPIIAEDLGVITPDVVAIQEKFSLPGMKVLVFTLDSGPVNPFLPHNHRRDNVIYTGTHDNDTVTGWYERIESDERNFFHQYLDYSGDQPNWELIKIAWASVGVFALTPAQDLLGLDNQARMNYPSRPSGNWQWRMRSDAMTPEIAERLSSLNQIYNRDKWDETEALGDVAPESYLFLK